MRSWSVGPLLLVLACGGEEAVQAVATPAVAAPIPAATTGASVQVPANVPAPTAEFDVEAVPEDLRSGAAPARIAAVARHEGEADATQALAWVMQTDSEPSVRQKAWKVLRARWKKGTGSAAEHEAAAIWAAANAEEGTRVEALATLGELGRDVTAPAKHLADEDQAVRAAAAEAVFDIANRTGKRADAKKLLQDRLALESSGPLRKRLDGWADKL